VRHVAKQRFQIPKHSLIVPGSDAGRSYVAPNQTELPGLASTIGFTSNK
jgi:hypothetical protein